MIIVGLGNPGKEYQGTRHNIGWEVLEAVAKKLNAPDWSMEQIIVEWTRIGERWLIKPWQYMNNTGPALKKFFNYKKIGSSPVELASSLIVIHDDLDFPVGQVKEQRDISAAGHQGVQSIIDTFGTQDFSRIRIGIGNNREFNIPAEDYVLQKFNSDEKKLIQPAIDQAVETITKKIT